MGGISGEMSTEDVMAASVTVSLLEWVKNSKRERKKKKKIQLVF